MPTCLLGQLKDLQRLPGEETHVLFVQKRMLARFPSASFPPSVEASVPGHGMTALWLYVSFMDWAVGPQPVFSRQLTMDNLGLRSRNQGAGQHHPLKLLCRILF